MLDAQGISAMRSIVDASRTKIFGEAEMSLDGAVGGDPVFLAVVRVVRGVLPDRWVCNPSSWYLPVSQPQRQEIRSNEAVVFRVGVVPGYRGDVCFGLSLIGSEIVFESSGLLRNGVVADLGDPESLEEIGRAVLERVARIERTLEMFVADQKMVK